MANLDIYNIDKNGVNYRNCHYEDGTIDATVAPATYPEGTLLARAANGNLVLFDQGGVSPADVPVAVLGQEEVVAASALQTRVIVTGQVRLSKISESGGATLTTATLDALRDYSILAVDTTQLLRLDNQ